MINAMSAMSYTHNGHRNIHTDYYTIYDCDTRNNIIPYIKLLHCHPIAYGMHPVNILLEMQKLYIWDYIIPTITIRDSIIEINT